MISFLQSFNIDCFSENTGIFDYAIKVSKQNGANKVLEKIADYDWDSFFDTPRSGLIVHSLT